MPLLGADSKTVAPTIAPAVPARRFPWRTLVAPALLVGGFLAAYALPFEDLPARPLRFTCEIAGRTFELVHDASERGRSSS